MYYSLTCNVHRAETASGNQCEKAQCYEALPFIFYSYQSGFQVCVSQLLFHGEQVSVYDDKDINDQIFWLDDVHGGCYEKFYELGEITIQNGTVSTCCGSTCT